VRVRERARLGGGPSAAVVAGRFACERGRSAFRSPGDVSVAAVEGEFGSTGGGGVGGWREGPAGAGR